MKETSLREIEKKTYMSYHQDGLIDIFVGIYVLLFGLGIFLEFKIGSSMFIVIPAIFPAVMVPIWIQAKKQITMPRIGFVKFRSRGASKLMAIFIGLMVAGLGTFMVFTFSSTQAWASMFKDLLISNSMIIIGFGAAAIAALFAYTMGLNRLYAYGLFSLALFLAGHYVTIPFEYFLLAIGLAIIVNGSVLLTRFIRKYPLLRGGKANAERPF